MRPAISFGDRPAYCQATPMTGTLISGKMSVGAPRAASTPKIVISSAMTMNV